MRTELEPNSLLAAHRATVANPVILLFVFCILFIPKSLSAISVGTTEKDTSPAAELASFTVLEGFEVNLFASEKDGVVNPISIRWDEHGRLWVLTTTSYPQPKPGEEVDDKILILEDTDRDGKCDKVTVFADKLRMPMGLELAPSVTWPAPFKVEGSSRALPNNEKSPDEPSTFPCAAYVGEGEKLWLMRDIDGDGRADVREVVFSGFGTGDMHQTPNSFTWTPDGALMFSQGLHCYSNITTAYGGRRLYGAGFWMYRPLTGKLTPYPTGFPLNAWGTVYDGNGQPFSVAGAAGMFWTTPLLISTEHLIEGRALPNNGQIVKQGMLKYCGVDIPRNSHWPQDMHGELVSGGFFENCIYRHKLQDDKANPSGYEAVRQPDLIKSSSVSFRPVDVKFGPEGALYISDWYNPIIGHYQASFRHPDRDKTHGRIWRVVKKGSPLVEPSPIALGKFPTSSLMSLLWRNNDSRPGALDGAPQFPEKWEEYQAWRLLMGKPQEEVLEELLESKVWGALPERCMRTLTEPWDEGPRHWPRAVGVAMMMRKLAAALELRQMMEHVDELFLVECLAVPSDEIRTLATRAIGPWHDRLKDPLGLLEKPIADESPRVRLEAIAACSHIPKPESIAVALRALDKPMDSFLDRSLTLSIHALAPHWESALQSGKLYLPPKHLAYLLEKKNSPEMLTSIRAMLSSTIAVPAVRVTGVPPVENSNSNNRRTPESALNTDSRRVLLLLLAKQGTSDDLSLALSEGSKDPTLLSQLADLVESQGLKAPGNAAAKVGEASSLATHRPASDSQATPAIARLIGLWKLTDHAPLLHSILESPETPPATKRHALIALARLDTPADKLIPFAQNTDLPWLVRLGAIEALCERHVSQAATSALALMPAAKTEDEMRSLLAPFLARAQRTKALVSAVTASPCTPESADLATRALIGMGRNEPELTAVFNKILGRTAPAQPFDSQFVSSLASQATVSGDPKRGSEIYHRVSLNCIACHQIGGQGGIIGPQLDAVGRGVPTELIVEAVLWPQRQIKEGYTATTVIMKDGRTLAGYKVAENGQDLQIRDMATQQVTTLRKADMQSRTDAGSLMPEGLTASLTRDELRDLIAFLASLGK